MANDEFQDPFPEFLTWLNSSREAAREAFASYLTRLLRLEPPKLFGRLSSEDQTAVAQETFLHLAGPEQEAKDFPRLTNYVPKGKPFANWVRTVVENKVRERFKKNSREIPTERQEIPDPPGDTRDDFEGVKTRSEEAEQLAKRQAFLSCFDSLSEICQLILTLRYYDDLGYKDIGRIAGLDNRTASDRSRRCRETLRKCLKKKGFTKFDDRMF